MWPMVELVYSFHVICLLARIDVYKRDSKHYLDEELKTLKFYKMVMMKKKLQHEIILYASVKCEKLMPTHSQTLTNQANNFNRWWEPYEVAQQTSCSTSHVSRRFTHFFFFFGRRSFELLLGNLAKFRLKDPCY